ncbi:MAG: MBL fold metallo-hydrolase [Eubacteriales bacterium]|nr:MBL fold metallo-hydrolase [Eubacteriales bacterium]
MEIFVLGSADMNSKYFSASYLIDKKTLVDMPGGASTELMRHGIDPTSVETVLITHMHGDHILGLPVWALQKSKMTPPPEEGSIRICVNEEQKPCLENIVRSSFSTSLTEEKTGRYFRWITENDLSLGDLHVQRIPVSHGTFPGCFGYLVSDGRVTVGFTGDSGPCEGVREIVSSSDLVFCDCDLITGTEKHMGIDDLLSLAEEFPDTKIAASHMRDETREELERLRPEWITIASDGDIFCL